MSLPCVQKEIELGDPTPRVDQVYLGCTQSAATVDEEPIRTKTEMIQMITTSNVDGMPGKKTSHTTQRGSSWGYALYLSLSAVH